MTKSLLHRLIISTQTVLLATSHGWACGNGTSTITGLSDAAGDQFQVTALSSSGLLTGSFSGSQPHAFLYSNGAVIDLGTLGGGESGGKAINAVGQVAGGSSLSDGESHAFLYNGGPLSDLGTLGGSFSTPAFINDAGQVVGNSLDEGDNDTVAFLYSGGVMSSLGTLGGVYSSAFWVNNNGVVCGEASNLGEDTHGFVYSAATMTDVGTLGGTSSSCAALNDAGTAVGSSTLANGLTHAFSFSSGVIKDLGTLGGSSSSASLINNNGQILGLSTIANNQAYHGFLVSGGVMLDLGTLGGPVSQGLALNNKGQVVGQSVTATGSMHAFLWQNGTMVDLNTMLPPNSGWQLMSARLLNDNGRIVGFGLLNGAFQWFIMDLASANHPPVANPGPDQTVECQTLVTLDGGSSTDPDSDPLSFQWSISGTVVGTNSTLTSSFPLGTNVITLKVSDPCGLSDQANVNVVVVDTIPPVVSCPMNTSAASDNNCQAAVPDLVSHLVVTDNCASRDSLLIVQSPISGTLVGVGVHPISVTVTDPSGNTSACSVLFTVIDQTPPVIISAPPLITLSATANCQALVPDLRGQIVASDNCTPASQLVVNQNPAAGTTIGVGQTPITMTVADSAGNTSVANILLVVADTTAPTILSSPGPITLSAAANCQALVPDLRGQIVASDNCTPASQLVMNQNPAAGTTISVGQTPIAVTVADAAGNTAIANILLIVADTTAPTILSSPGPITLSATANCQALVPDLRGQIVASDNCTPASQLVMNQNPAAGTTIGVGQTPIAVTVADAAGNTAIANILLNVADTTAPTILSSPGPITLSVDANCQAAVPNVLTNVLVTDNCTPANQLVLVQDPPAGTLLPRGQSVINVTVSDAAGNKALTGVPLTIADLTPPAIQSLTVSPNVLGPPNHELLPVTVSILASDSCGAVAVSKIIKISCSEATAPGDIQITGNLTANLAASKNSNGTSRIYTITVRSSDSSGNSSTGNVIVTVPKSNGTSSETGTTGGWLRSPKDPE